MMNICQIIIEKHVYIYINFITINATKLFFKIICTLQVNLINKRRKIKKLNNIMKVL